MKYVRQKEFTLLSKSDAAIVTKARDLYGEAVEASTASALQGNAGVVGDSVRQAFAKAMPMTDIYACLLCLSLQNAASRVSINTIKLQSSLCNSFAIGSCAPLCNQ